ncbi:MAG: ATP-binding protein [Nanoarchaeota archaeon]|nr:ATP-binding protein [Nanoarchaeota archaeon]
MIPQFINRKQELQFLEEAYRSSRAEMIVLYGRRRIGKTEIITHFCKGKPHIYYLCTEDSEKNNMDALISMFGEYLEKPIMKELKAESWMQIFKRFIELLGKNEKKIVIAIDEFPFLISLNRGITSIFLKLWDEMLKKENIMLIISGSSVSMMETDVLGYKSPLYGRRTGQWKVQMMELKHLGSFFPGYSIEELVQAYGILGGVPAYLQEFENSKNIFENIKDAILQKGKYLYQEVEFMLKQEFREQRTYLAILKKMALGFNSIGKLCAETGMDKANLSKYLAVLEETGIIRHILPLGKKRGGIYAIDDPFFNFWLKMAAPHQAEIESGNAKNVAKVIEKGFPGYMGRMFEAICERQILSGGLKAPINITGVAKWWHKDKEIDIIAIDENKREALFIECKWQDLREKEAEKILAGLKEKSSFVAWKREKNCFGIIAKNIAGKERLRKAGFWAVDLNDFR